ncbi:MAG: hypothetical protein J6M91_01035, partial [Methanobrevibacter sp.]|nr:hypothetical protein [Methanobrevibacter sp.]
GNLNLSSEKVDFCKYPQHIQEEMENFGALAVKEMKNLNSASCGNRLRLSTNSKEIVLKVQLKRKWEYQKMLNWNASGFDVYAIKHEKYEHLTVFGPSNGHDIFAEKIIVPQNGKLCIFLPNYNTIEHMFIGIEKGTKIEEFDYPKNKKLPILFYGNSVTQGAAASRSGNTFPNIVSKKLNRNIINLSCSSCCRGTESVAKLIGEIDCHCIVIDYTRNAHTIEDFNNSHEKFYEIIRSFHPDTKIIFLTSECYNNWRPYDEFDKIVNKTYQNAMERNENVELLNQRELFDKEEYDFVTIDSSHYTDYGMFKVAEKICELINK